MEIEMKRDLIKTLTVEELDIEGVKRRTELTPLAVSLQWTSCDAYSPYSNYGG
jgi:hypothetical protein